MKLISKLSLAVLSVLMLNVSLSQGASLIEDFEDVSDWTVSVGPSAASGSISTSAAEAQVGSFAGQFDYGLTAAVGSDYVQYTKTFGTPIDITAAVLSLRLKQPNDPDMLLQLRFTSGNGGFLEYDFPEGNDVWTSYNLPFSSFADYGSGPDLTDIVSVRWQALGDLSATATTDTFFVDQMQILVPEPSTALLMLAGGGLMACRRRRK